MDEYAELLSVMAQVEIDMEILASGLRLACVDPVGDFAVAAKCCGPGLCGSG